jgi:hypothetical protein
MTSEVEETYVLIQECPYDPPHSHEFPSDWFFGGPDLADPRADPRWIPPGYVYLDGSLHPVHTTSAPVCDDQAIDEFTLVASWGLKPVYLQVRRPGQTKLEIVPWTYDEPSDSVSPFK